MHLSALRSRVPFLRNLPPSQLDWLAPHVEIRVLKRGDKVWFEGQVGDQFIFVIRGRVKFARTTRGGREAIMDLAGPGDLSCTSTVCGYAPYCCAAVAMEDGTEVMSIPRRNMFELFERIPAIGAAILGEVTKQTMHACDRVEQLSSGQVEQRLATVLVKLAQRVGVERADGIWIPVPLSRQDLADMCGTTVETVIRTLSKLRESKLVRTTTRGFLIASLPPLENLARSREGLVELRLNKNDNTRACG
jgi:CRP/FNR family transcriptional regulator